MTAISIVTSGHFCTSPRVWKEADALASAGHEVTVIGVCYDPIQAALDETMLKGRCWRYVAAADLRVTTRVSRWVRTWFRLRRRLGRARTARGWPDPHALGYGVDRLLAVAQRQRADLTILHLESALWIGDHLARRGGRIGVDMEDWHSENDPILAAGPRFVTFLRQVERRALQAAAHVTTTSAAMANALGQAYGRNPPPTVIHNSIPGAPLLPAEEAPGAGLRLLWFSQTLGAGRGLEDVCAALGRLGGEWKLTLLANSTPQTREWVYRQVSAPVRERIQFRATVPPDDLTRAVAAHDVGLALEIPWCRNKDLTASNKIFQYLQTGLPAVCTDTAGQREVMAQVPGSGWMYPSGDAGSLAAILNRIRAAVPQIRQRRPQLHEEANRRLAYETQVSRLLQSVEDALRPRPGARCSAKVLP